MDGAPDPTDLYSILSLPRTASTAEVKKAYHKAALKSHPDKVPPSERESAEIEFKAISQAFEILSDPEKRSLYDQHGMAAFEKGAGGMPGQGVDMDDILAQMFGFGMGGGGPGGPGGMPKRPRRGQDEEQEYAVTLEELYKGKTTRFASTKNVICSQCSGSGGKERAKPKPCDTCKGAGVYQKLQSVGPGLVSPISVTCGTCNGAGKWFKEKDRCKKCKGKRTVQSKKMLELYIPPGSREGEEIRLRGEADQHPDQDEAGDIVFHLAETVHDVFSRAGADLHADMDVELVEALTGLDRVVVKHLDGRGISLSILTPTDLPLTPGQTLKIEGEGMPVKKSDTKGDLYLSVKIAFPEKGWIGDHNVENKLKEVLPKPGPAIEADDVDELDAVMDATMEDFGAGSDDPRAGAEWEDETEGQGAQCAQQ